MLKIVSVKGRDRPSVFCDHCGQLIAEARNGNYEWSPHDGVIYFTHKHCSTPFRKAHPNITMSMELRVLPVYLERNLDIDHKKAEEDANEAV